MAIYFIRANGTGPIKIGYTGHSGKHRLNRLQVYNYVDLTLLAEVPGDRALERKFQERFSDSHIRGEWYAPTEELLDFIKRLPRPKPDRPREPRTRWWRDLSSVGRKYVRKVWRDLSIASDKEAAEKLGINRQTLKLNLGPSGRIPDPNHMAKMGALGGKVTAERVRNSRMPLDMARAIWAGKENIHRSNEDVLHLINRDKRWKVGWSMTTAYRLLGKREASPGRRAKKR